MMKIKNFMTMMVTAVALVTIFCSCSSDDDDEPVVAVPAQVAGSYTGTEVLTVMGEPDDNTVTFEFKESSAQTVDMTIPSYGMDMMTLPALPVKNIILVKSGDNITGKVAKYESVVTNPDGSEKAFTLTDLTVIFNGKTVVVTFTLKYGNMPFAFEGQFTGTKK
jgi:hypothetical protein